MQAHGNPALTDVRDNVPIAQDEVPTMATAVAQPSPPASSTPTRIPMWLDCDPGHDDAMAIILAGHSPKVHLLGISTVAGNQTLAKVTRNALDVLHAAGLGHIGVVAGQSRPLVRPSAILSPEIHGDSGLDVGRSGTERLPRSPHSALEGKACNVMFERIRSHFDSEGGERRVRLVCTGALSNAALLLTVYPEVAAMVEIVIMGGSVGVGNTAPVAEFNIQTDPEAAKIVFEAGVPLTMVPLRVTHTVLVTPMILSAIGMPPASVDSLVRELSLSDSVEPAGGVPPAPAAVPPASKCASAVAEHVSPTLAGIVRSRRPVVDYSLGDDGVSTSYTAPSDEARHHHHHHAEDGAPLLLSLAAAKWSPFRALVRELLMFFAATYREVFRFKDPPLHDPCAVAYCIAPELFQVELMRVDIETTSPLSSGQTVCDIWHQSGRPANCHIAMHADVMGFWHLMLAAVDAADAISPLNMAPGALEGDGGG